MSWNSPVQSQVHKECPNSLWNNLWVGYTSICKQFCVHAFEPEGYFNVNLISESRQMYISVQILLVLVSTVSLETLALTRKFISVEVLDTGRYILVEVLAAWYLEGQFSGGTWYNSLDVLGTIECKGRDLCRGKARRPARKSFTSTSLFHFLSSSPICRRRRFCLLESLFRLFTNVHCCCHRLM